jgi:hypothetical protein
MVIYFVSIEAVATQCKQYNLMKGLVAFSHFLFEMFLADMRAVILFCI